MNCYETFKLPFSSLSTANDRQCGEAGTEKKWVKSNAIETPKMTNLHSLQFILINLWTHAYVQKKG